MQPPALRKPKHYFDIGSRPSHVTFDDGKTHRRNLPWMHYVEANWDYAEPDAIKIVMGDWLVVIVGQNLDSLFGAIEDNTLIRIRAQPELGREGDHGVDSFATEIHFLKVAQNGPKRGAQAQLPLGAL